MYGVALVNRNHFMKFSDVTIKTVVKYYQFTAGMNIDADGSPHAYHPDSSKGLDYLANAGSPGNWYGLVTDKAGKPVLQPNGYYISTTSLVDKTKAVTDPTRYVNSETIPYIVLPAYNRLSVTLGDFVVCEYNGKCVGGIYADVGGANVIGEASIAMAKALGINSDPKRGGVENGVKYYVFPGTSIGFISDENIIQQKALGLYNSFVGSKV